MAKVSVVHDGKLTRKLDIVSFLNCGRCLQEKPSDVSPSEWARLNVGLTPDGSVQVWCVRHNVNVDHMTLTTNRARTSNHE
jgi:hypothetical protein